MGSAPATASMRPCWRPGATPASSGGSSATTAGSSPRSARCAFPTPARRTTGRGGRGRPKLKSYTPAPRTVAKPLTTEGVVAKFRVLTDGIVEPGGQQAIVDAVQDLERLERMEDLTALLAPPVGAAF